MEEIIRFLRENVDGRTVHTAELVYALENGALEGIYADQMSFSNLRCGADALTLDMFIVSNEKIYEVQDGARGPLRKDESAVSLFQYELARRQSTGEVTGFFRFVSASGRSVLAAAIVSGIRGVRVEGGVLQMREEQALYRDQHAGAGYRPVAFTANQRFFLEGGKLHFEYEGQSFTVDPQTLEKTPSDDEFPTFHSIER